MYKKNYTKEWFFITALFSAKSVGKQSCNETHYNAACGNGADGDQRTFTRLNAGNSIFI